MGRYILTPEIFGLLEHQEAGVDGDNQLTDSIQKLNEIHQVYAYEFEGMRFDVGDKLGFIKTTVEIALNNEEIGVEVEQMLYHLLKHRRQYNK